MPPWKARDSAAAILMTSFAFILGAFPLWFASGSGRSGAPDFGYCVIVGMLAATLIRDLHHSGFFLHGGKPHDEVQ